MCSALAPKERLAARRAPAAAREQCSATSACPAACGQRIALRADGRMGPDAAWWLARRGQERGGRGARPAAAARGGRRRGVHAAGGASRSQARAHWSAVPSVQSCSAACIGLRCLLCGLLRAHWHPLVPVNAPCISLQTRQGRVGDPNPMSTRCTGCSLRHRGHLPRAAQVRRGRRAGPGQPAGGRGGRARAAARRGGGRRSRARSLPCLYSPLFR